MGVVKAGVVRTPAEASAYVVKGCVVAPAEPARCCCAIRALLRTGGLGGATTGTSTGGGTGVLGGATAGTSTGGVTDTVGSGVCGKRSIQSATSVTEDVSTLPEGVEYCSVWCTLAANCNPGARFPAPGGS